MPWPGGSPRASGCGKEPGAFSGVSGPGPLSPRSVDSRPATGLRNSASRLRGLTLVGARRQGRSVGSEREPAGLPARVPGLSGALGTRVVWLGLALVTTAVLFALLMSVLYVQTVRRMRLRLAEGTVLESGFEDGVVRLCGPLSDSTLTSEGIQWIRTSGAWVLIRQRGVPLIGLWPAALFPRQELERVTSAVSHVP